MSRRFITRRQWLAMASLSAMYAGCDRQTNTSTENKANAESKNTSTELRILVADNGELAEALIRQWQYETEGKLNVRTIEARQLESARRLSADVAVIPAHLLGQLIENDLLAPVPTGSLSSRSGYAYPDVLPSLRGGQVSWGRAVYGASLGQPSFVLGVHANVLKEQNVPVPQTWDDLAAAVDAVKPPAGKADFHAVVEPSGTGVSGQLILARAASFAAAEGQLSWAFTSDELKPRVTDEHFVEALAQHVRCARATAANPVAPREAWEKLVRGEAAMAIVALSQSSAPPGEGIEIAPLPGSKRMFSFESKSWVDRKESEPGRVQLIGYSGTIACVTRESRSPKASQNFIDWLSRPEVIAAVCQPNNATGPFLTPQLEDVKPWLPKGTDSNWAAQYAKAIDCGPRWTHSLRLPGASQYMAALDAAAMRCLADATISPATALAETAEAWTSITKRLNESTTKREAQLRAYRRSLGSDG